jgi:hypothetical protein
LLPFTPDDAFDEGDYRRHLTWLAEALSQAGLFEPAVAN